MEKGLKGELYARLMWILDVDFARQGDVQPESVQFDYSTSVPVPRFFDGNFKQLSVEQHTHLYNTRKPPPPLAPTSQKLDANANLTFTHFTFTTSKLPKSPPDTLSLLCNLLRRNAGLQLSPYQEHWDLLIPVYHGFPGEPFNRNAVSAILVQVKNTVKNNSNRYFVGEKEIREHFHTDRPIFQFLMDLGCNTGTTSISEDNNTTRLGSSKGNVYTIVTQSTTAMTFGFLSANVGGRKLEEVCQSFMGCLGKEFEKNVHDDILKKVVAGVHGGLYEQ